MTDREPREIAEQDCLEHEVECALLKEHSLGGTLRDMLLSQVTQALQKERTARLEAEKKLDNAVGALREILVEANLQADCGFTDTEGHPFEIHYKVRERAKSTLEDIEGGGK